MRLRLCVCASTTLGRGFNEGLLLNKSHVVVILGAQLAATSCLCVFFEVFFFECEPKDQYFKASLEK